MFEQEQEPPPDCQHDLYYDSSYGEIVCFNCGLIKGPLLVATSHSYYRPGSNNNGLYLKRCVTDHQEQNNCFIPYNVYNDFEKFQRCFIEKFPNEPKKAYDILYSAHLNFMSTHVQQLPLLP